jgi:membrane-associated phospholipid phosphatase
MTMEAIWRWGLEFIHTVQLIGGPVTDLVFKAITFMGEEDFFMILLPLLLWCVDLAVGIRVSVVFLLSTYGNEYLKQLFGHPRPFELDDSVRLHDAEGYGLPSGHSESAVVVWGTIAAEFRKRWMWVVAVSLMVLIGFSRIYLGVHFPTDVLGGWMVGAVVLLMYIALGRRFEAWLKRAGLVVQLALAVVVPLALVLLRPTDTTIAAMGVLMGAGAGVALTRRFFSFSAAGLLWQRGARVLLGFAILLALRVGLQAVFPAEGEPLYLALRFVRYALVGLWAGLGAPWLFLKLRLASPA